MLIGETIQGLFQKYKVIQVLGSQVHSNQRSALVSRHQDAAENISAVAHGVLHMPVSGVALSDKSNTALVRMGAVSTENIVAKSMSGMDGVGCLNPSLCDQCEVNVLQRQGSAERNQFAVASFPHVEAGNINSWLLSVGFPLLPDSEGLLSGLLLLLAPRANIVLPIVLDELVVRVAASAIAETVGASILSLALALAKMLILAVVNV